MTRHKTKAIVLKRTNYADADKIISLLTEKFGRISVLAKGVRKSGARMAAGVEPFSVSDIEFINGKSNLSTLVSARPDKQYSYIVKEYERAVLGGEMLRLMNEYIEDDVDGKFFELAEELLEVLDDSSISGEVIETWFRLQLLALLGRQPNLLTDSKSKKLQEDKTYHFDPADGVFMQSEQGGFSSENIKAWRVLMLKSPRGTRNVKGLSEAVKGGVEALRQFTADNSF